MKSFTDCYKIVSLLLFVLLLSTSCKKNKTFTPVTVIPPVPKPVWDVNALRGAWVTTAASTALDSRANIAACVQTCKAAGINNILWWCIIMVLLAIQAL